MYIFFTDLKHYQKVVFCCMKMYLQVRIENHWTVPPDEPPPPSVSPPPKRVFSLHSAEGVLKKFVQQTA